MPGYVLDHETSLVLSERLKVSATEVLSVRDHLNNEIFKIHGSKISPTGKKTLTDARTNTDLYRLTEPVVSMRETRKIEDAQTGEVLFTMHKKGMVTGTHTVLVWRGSNDKGDAIFSISGGFREKEFDIKVASSEQIVARVRKQTFNFRNLLLYVFLLIHQVRRTMLDSNDTVLRLIRLPENRQAVCYFASLPIQNVTD
jgi:uncharacterized protein YxjI